MNFHLWWKFCGFLFWKWITLLFGIHFSDSTFQIGTAHVLKNWHELFTVSTYFTITIKITSLLVYGNNLFGWHSTFTHFNNKKLQQLNSITKKIQKNRKKTFKHDVFKNILRKPKNYFQINTTFHKNRKNQNKNKVKLHLKILSDILIDKPVHASYLIDSDELDRQFSEEWKK